MGVRTGIIGCGIAADNYHLPTIRSSETASLVAVADKEQLAMDDIDDATTYTDYEAMLREEDLDSVHLLTPPTFRIPPVEAAAEEEVSVYIEEPRALDTETIDEIISLRDDANIKICCTQNMQFMPLIQKTLTSVEQGTIGDVVATETTFSNPSTSRGKRRDSPGRLICRVERSVRGRPIRSTRR